MSYFLCWNRLVWSFSFFWGTGVSLATVVPIPIPITNTNPFAISSFKLFSQRIQSLGLSLMSLTSFLGATKERPTLKRDGATSRHLVGYRIPMVDGRLSWKRHLLTTNVLSSCFFVLIVHTAFCNRTKSDHWWPWSSSLPKMARFICLHYPHDQKTKASELFLKRQSHISHSPHSCATVDSGQTFKSWKCPRFWQFSNQNIKNCKTILDSL